MPNFTCYNAQNSILGALTQIQLDELTAHLQTIWLVAGFCGKKKARKWNWSEGEKFCKKGKGRRGKGCYKSLPTA